MPGARGGGVGYIGGVIALLALACTSPADDCPPSGGADTAVDTAGDTAEDTGPVDLPAVEVVHVTTEDGLTLEGDYYGNVDGAEAVLLLHMIPPTYDRTTWPLDFVETLRADGYAVLALDRRGAGASEGVAQDAYEGPDGVLDAYAAVDLLTDRGAPGIVVIGASNGTTTTLDYALTAADHGRPAPRSMIWMSPGEWTENNHKVASLDATPLLFVYPASEKAWSEAIHTADDPTDRWTYRECPGRSHGTFLFDTIDGLGESLRDWLAASR